MTFLHMPERVVAATKHLRREISCRGCFAIATTRSGCFFFSLIERFPSLSVIYIYIYIYIYMCVCVCVCMYTHAHTFVLMSVLTHDQNFRFVILLLDITYANYFLLHFYTLTQIFWSSAVCKQINCENVTHFNASRPENVNK
jgi:hypothetical protein